MSSWPDRVTFSKNELHPGGGGVSRGIGVVELLFCNSRPLRGDIDIATLKTPKFRTLETPQFPPPYPLISVDKGVEISG